VLPGSAGGWDQLGHIPGLDEKGETDTESRRVDVAELAFQAARDRVVLRVHPSLGLPSALSGLAGRHQGQERPAWREALAAAYETLPEDESHYRQTVRCLLAGGFTYEVYPDGQGVVFMAQRRLRTSRMWFPPLDDGDDSISRVARRDRVSLADHANHVLKVLDDLLTTLPLTDLAEALRQAGTLHDHGKADDRFQAMLKRESRTEAWLGAGRSAFLLAKSDALPETQRVRKVARQRAQLPDGFRHEMLSLQMAQKSRDLPKDSLLRDLTLHLIAAHHGHARPLAPAIVDEAPPDVRR
jgi:CRISPR-associated endonuclease/helicase Cas3